MQPRFFVGFLGVLLFIVSYQLRSNRALFLCQLMGCIVFFTQFLFWGAYTGAISLIINIVRNLLLLKAKDWAWVRNKATPSVIILFMAIFTAYTWAGLISFLPFLSVTVTSVGYWTCDAKKIRIERESWQGFCEWQSAKSLPGSVKRQQVYMPLTLWTFCPEAIYLDWICYLPDKLEFLRNFISNYALSF